MKIRQEYGLPKISEGERQYSALPETAPGEYAQVDFGQTKLRKSDGARIKVYFIAILLSHSRYKFIWFQDRPFTSETAVIGHEKLPDTVFPAYPHDEVEHSLVTYLREVAVALPEVIMFLTA